MRTILNPDFQYSVAGSNTTSDYCSQLLIDLGASIRDIHAAEERKPDNRWKESGLANLTGYPDQPLDHCPVPVAEYADGAIDALRVLTGQRTLPDYQGAELLALRSTMAKHQRQGRIAPGGSCRLLPCLDGMIAVNLARESDWELLDAWLLDNVPPNWKAVEARVSHQSKAHLLEQGRLLGLAVADAQPHLPRERHWYELIYRGRVVTERKKPPRVIDLSSLWAGPLCGRLLLAAGAEVIKVESSTRPDGARRGAAEFFQFLNHGKQESFLDLKNEYGVSSLINLIRSADIVIEASRPRALRQMGLKAEQMIDENPGLTWIGISGYGRSEPEENWIAYGDDAGVAGGLSAEIHRATGQWMFCGDAIADPLTGIHAALAAYASWQAGGGHLLSLSLVNTIQNCLQTRRKNEDTPET